MEAANGQLISSFTNTTVPPLLKTHNSVLVATCNPSDLTQHWKVTSKDDGTGSKVMSFVDGLCLDGSGLSECNPGAFVCWYLRMFLISRVQFYCCTIYISIILLQFNQNFHRLHDSTMATSNKLKCFEFQHFQHRHVS